MRYYFIICIILLGGNVVFAQNADTVSVNPIQLDSVDLVNSVSENECLVTLQKRPWLAAGEIFTLNMGVWSFDRLIKKDKYAHINWQSIKKNFRTGFLWDNDSFSTNLFTHPYHGNLYFNIARSNGFNFWQSVPYTVGGSLMWELAMESAPPSINDLISTSLGGICLGEMTWRISDLFIDQSVRGMERVARETAVFIFSPMRGLNRLLSGDTQKYSSCASQTIAKPDLIFTTALNYRYLADNAYPKDGTSGMEVNVDLVYGNPMEDFDGKPYSFFTLDAKLNFISNQPVLGGINVKALLWGTHWRPNPQGGVLFGVFQHFNYQESNPINERQKIFVPYEISEVASFGGGMIYSLPVSDRLFFFGDVYLNGVLLGGNHTDHYQARNRDYNLGSGYCFKIFPGISWQDVGSLRLGIDRIHLYTWKGYDENLKIFQLPEEKIMYLDAQGDKGNTYLTTITAQMIIQIYKNLELNLSQAYYLRHSHYAYFPDVRYQAIETKAGLLYRFR
ncbi:MAG: DUF3943 domain-containing protein [Prevotellaceae bacterium]|jgi:hypothetical protein|nr:DUF3943 domain-containing protein [Prevotellaceae bacterium]